MSDVTLHPTGDGYMEVVDLNRPAASLVTATLPELMAKSFPAPYFIVPDLLPEGTTLLAGKAKKGKSWFALGIGLAAAFGGVALNCMSVERNGVLYLALEDSEELLQDRVKQLLQNARPPENFHYAVLSPMMDGDGVMVLEDWIKAHPDIRFVVIDTLKRIRPASRGRNAYDEDYEALAPLADLSHRHRIALLALHHLRKDPSEGDPFDEISGSMGLQATPDTLMVLRGTRGNADAVLHVVGRRLKEEKQLALSFDRESGVWQYLGDAREVVMPNERQEILDALDGADGPLSPKDLAGMLGKDRTAIRMMLSRMVKSGQLGEPRGGYYVFRYSEEKKSVTPVTPVRLPHGQAKKPVTGPELQGVTPVTAVTGPESPPVTGQSSLFGASTGLDAPCNPVTGVTGGYEGGVDGKEMSPQNGHMESTEERF